MTTPEGPWAASWARTARVDKGIEIATAAIVATTGIILGAAYMLWLYWRIAFGVARTEGAAAMTDLSMREWWLLGPIAAGVFWMGIYPETFIRPFRADVTRVVQRLERAAPAGDSHLTAGKPGTTPAAHGAEAH